MPLDVAEDRIADQDLPAVDASLLFAAPSHEPLFVYTYDPPPGAPAANAVYEPHAVTIRDMRPIAGRLSLDVQGFELVHHRSAVRDFWDEAQVLALGVPEAAELVQAATGARRVVVFDQTLRRRADGLPDRASGSPRQPATRAHNDYTAASGPQRVRDLMGEEAAEALLQRRAAIVNVWRPISHPARDWPLAVCDASSVRPEDLVSTALIYQHRRGETQGVHHDPGQRWFYAPEMRTDEAILLKCWDSDPAVARFTPHTGFEDPTTPPGTPPRESIEFRTIAFF